jgi:hypothetical protein
MILLFLQDWKVLQQDRLFLRMLLQECYKTQDLELEPTERHAQLLLSQDHSALVLWCTPRFCRHHIITFLSHYCTDSR